MSRLPVTIFPGLGGRLAPENERIVERERSTDEGEKERDKIWERERETPFPLNSQSWLASCVTLDIPSLRTWVSSLIRKRGEWIC